MNGRFLFIIIWMFFKTNELHAQKYDNTWMHIYPGADTVGLPEIPPYPAVLMDFKVSPPKVTYLEVPYPGYDADVVVSDFNGEPLFRTNGHQINYFNGGLMENGDSIFPEMDEMAYPFGEGPRFAMMVLPRPEHPDDYYLFQLCPAITGLTTKLLYDLIEGATSPTTGKVVQKAVPMFLGHDWINHFNATKHANGRDWWVVFSDIDQTAHTRIFYSYLVDPNGVSLQQTQVLEGYGPVTDHAYDELTIQRVFSPDGHYFISHDATNGTRIHTFDRCTGLLGPAVTLPFQFGHWGTVGVAVSPNSRYLYVATTEHIMQYDLNAADIVATKDTIAEFDGYVDPVTQGPVIFGYPQLALDGKIYYTLGNGFYIHVILKPNKAGTDCSFAQRMIKLPILQFGYPYYPNYRLGPLDGTLCDSLGLNNEPLADFWWFADSTLSVEFSDNSSYQPSQWHWDFGDGSISQDTSPVHVFPNPGAYNVCLTVSNQFASDTICKLVEVGATPVTAPTPRVALQVYPNPTTGTIHWETDANEPANVLIFNLMGQLLLQKTTSENDIDIHSLPAGIYILDLQTGQKRLRTKVVKH